MNIVDIVFFPFLNFYRIFSPKLKDFMVFIVILYLFIYFLSIVMWLTKFDLNLIKLKLKSNHVI